jgi:hypothetical protein
MRVLSSDWFPSSLCPCPWCYRKDEGITQPRDFHLVDIVLTKALPLLLSALGLRILKKSRLYWHLASPHLTHFFRFGVDTY